MNTFWCKYHWWWWHCLIHEMYERKVGISPCWPAAGSQWRRYCPLIVTSLYLEICTMMMMVFAFLAGTLYSAGLNYMASIRRNPSKSRIWRYPLHYYWIAIEAFPPGEKFTKIQEKNETYKAQEVNNSQVSGSSWNLIEFTRFLPKVS